MLELIVTTVFVYFLYYIWIVYNFDRAGNITERRKKKNKSIEKKMPAEVKLFVKRYNVDLDRVNYRYFLETIGLIVAFDIAIVANVVIRVNTLWVQLLLIFILVMLITLVSFELLGRYFKKKGLTKNENDKRDRKQMAENMGR